MLKKNSATLEEPVVEKTPSRTMATVTLNNNIVSDVNRIAHGAKYIGDLATTNDIRIDGDYEGRLYCEGRLVVGEKATIKGDIFCTDADFGGTMIGGNIYTRETLYLKGGCSVNGNLFFQRFQVELDAKFTGSCKVLSEGEFAKLSAPVAALQK